MSDYNAITGVITTEEPEIAVSLDELRYLVFRGMTGDSAYEEAVSLGFVGTEAEWIASLKGAPGANGRDGQDGAPGTPGRDGVSPTVQTEPITGGNRVTITDAAHPTGQTFDVMDGDPGADYVLTPQDKQEIADQAAALVDVPTKTSELQNDSGFVTAQQAAAAAPVQSVNGRTGSVTVNEVPEVGGTDNKKVLTANNGSYTWEAVPTGETTKRISLYKDSQTGVYTCSMSATQLHEALPNVVLATEDYRVPVSAYSIDKDDSYVKAVFIDDRPENNAAIVWTLSAASASDLVAVTREECSIVGLPDYTHAVNNYVLAKTTNGPRWVENIPRRAASLRLLYDGAFAPSDPDLYLMSNLGIETAEGIRNALIYGTIGSAEFVDVSTSTDHVVYDLYKTGVENGVASVVFAHEEADCIRTVTMTGNTKSVPTFGTIPLAGGTSANAVLYTPQTLTDAQQEQARTNIGAGTYTKPSGGIPKADLASDVQTSLGKADTALQEHQSLTGYATETWVQNRGYQTAAEVQTAIAGKADSSSVYTKTEVDQKLVGAMDYKGTKATVSELPTSGNATGDVWHITADGSEWAWNGEQWEELGKSSSVLYTEQSLTPAQQAQACENINALHVSTDTDAPGGGAFEPVDLSSQIEIVEGEAWRWAGHASADSGWWRTNKLSVLPGYTYRFINFPRFMYLYPASGGGDGSATGNLGTGLDVEYTVPENVYYIGFYQQLPARSNLKMYRLTPTPEEESTLAVALKSDVFSLTESNLKRESIVELLTPLKNKKIVNFGDSVFGNYSAPDDISSFLAAYTGADVYNCGFGGTMMATHWNADYALFSFHALADAIVSGDWSAQDAALADSSWQNPEPYPERLAVLKGIDFSEVDIITIAYGTNDWNSGKNIDNAQNPKDVSTYCGAFRYGIEKLIAKYPNIRFFVCAPIFRVRVENGEAVEYSDTWQNASGKTIPDFCAALRNVAAEYGIKCIDDYYELGVNRVNWKTFLHNGDGTHPNAAGRKRIARNIADGITSVGVGWPVQTDAATQAWVTDKGYLTLADLPIYNGGVT